MDSSVVVGVVFVGAAVVATVVWLAGLRRGASGYDHATDHDAGGGRRIAEAGRSEDTSASGHSPPG